MDTKGAGVLLILVFLGLFGVFIGMGESYDHNVAVQESEQTTGTVESTDIRVTEDDDGDESYSPIVTYTYTVDGETRTHDNVFPGRSTRSKGSRSWAQDIVDDYQAGDEVTVNYRGYKPGLAYIRNDEGLPSSWWIGIAYAGLSALAGGWFIWVGFRRWRQRQLITNTPAENAQSLSIGPSEIKGSADPGEYEPLAAPFSDDDCVLADYEIKEYREDNDDDGGGSWNTVKSDVYHMPFKVDDGTGKVLVRPHDDATYDLDPDDWTETYVDSSSRGPQPIQEFIGAHDGIGYPSNRNGKEHDRKYKQNIIRPDENVYVFGTVQPREEAEFGATDADRLVVEKVEDDSMREPMFLISDDEEQDLINRRKWALWRLPVGAFWLVIALVNVLFIYGGPLGLRVPVFF